MYGSTKTLKHNVRNTLWLAYHNCKNLTHTSKTCQVNCTYIVATTLLTIHMFITFSNCYESNATKPFRERMRFKPEVSNENFSETLWPSGWALGQATWAKMTLKLLHLWRNSWKTRTLQSKIFLSAIY